jgi:hypothetical protein
MKLYIKFSIHDSYIFNKPIPMPPYLQPVYTIYHWRRSALTNYYITFCRLSSPEKKLPTTAIITEKITPNNAIPISPAI